MALGQMFDTTLPLYGDLTTPLGQHKRVSISIEGVFQTNAVNYNLSQVARGGSITSTFWDNLLTQARNENIRRGKSATRPSLSTNISAVDYNGIRTLFNVSDDRTNRVYDDWSGANANLPNGPTVNSPTVRNFPATAAPSVPAAMVAGSEIQASVLNSLINALNSAGSVCTCNCNYCTCNCNYCTCNCNYSCTCNCNYSSDRRLKTLVKFLKKIHGLNLYSFSYYWDTSKTYVGVMAQELLGTKYESALNKNSLGYYMVDYSKLPVKMTEVK